MKDFFARLLKGACIGVAMIIPGVSGGTLAVLLNIYQNLIDAIANLRKDFINSVKYILPIAIGMALAFIAVYFPLNWALKHCEFIIISLFVGLMLGSLPKLIKDAKNNGIKKIDAIELVLPAAILIGLCFLPSHSDVTLGGNFLSYVLLVIVGVVASFALVVPGISGSMLLLLLGYYKPLFATISNLKTDFLGSVLILGVFAVGLIIGFFTISKIMKLLLEKFPRVTYWAIVSFVIGSFVGIYLEYDYAINPIDAKDIIIGAVLLILGALASYLLINSIDKKQEDTSIEQE